MTDFLKFSDYASVMELRKDKSDDKSEALDSEGRLKNLYSPLVDPLGPMYFNPTACFYDKDNLSPYIAYIDSESNI